MGERETPKDGWLVEQIADAKANIASWPDGYADGLCMAGADLSELAALRAENERLRDEAAERDMDAGALDAIRERLKAAGMPEAAFIDDHVGNAIVQRDQAVAENARLREALNAAIGHMMNALITLEAGGTKRQSADTLRHALARARAALEVNNPIGAEKSIESIA